MHTIRYYLDMITEAEQPYEQWFEDYVDRRPVVRVRGEDGSVRPPRYLYRVISQSEYAAAKKNGVFRPRPGERIHASSRPDRSYANSPEALTVRFAYRDEDGWRAKWGKDLYAVTDQPVPFDRAELV